METKALSNINITQNTDGQLVVSSRQVAEHFEKEHRNVLANIHAIQGEVSCAENSAQWFYLTLAMGFTGTKAMQWKIKYIEAFNAMERRSSNSRPATCWKTPSNAPSAGSKNSKRSSRP